MASRWGENGVGSSSTLPWRLRDLAMSLLLVALMIGLYAVAGAIDEHDDANVRRIAEAERARIAAQRQLPAEVRESYARDLAEEERRCLIRRDGRTYCYRGDPR